MSGDNTAGGLKMRWLSRLRYIFVLLFLIFVGYTYASISNREEIDTEFINLYNTIKNNQVPDELIEILYDIRKHFGKPIQINSGTRTPEHNKMVGGATYSKHLYGQIVDFTVKDTKTIDVYDYLISKYDNRPLGIARKISSNPYAGFIHLDVRDKRSRWNYVSSLY